jgi:hypothetical protein
MCEWDGPFDSGGLKLIHFGGLKLIRPYVQCPPV